MLPICTETVSITEEIGTEQAHPEKRDVYWGFCQSSARITSFQRYRREHVFELVILRSGVIYGEHGNVLPSESCDSTLAVYSCRSAAAIGPPHLCAKCNCASAVVLAAQGGKVPEGIYNVVDDDLPTSTEYLRQYRFHVGKIRLIRLPLLLAHGLSKGI